MEKENKEDFQFKFFPWDKGENPYHVNEEGFEWYLDESVNRWIKSGEPLKNTCCFFVKKGDFVKRVLVNNKQQILHEDSSLEGMCCYIDMLKLIQ